MTTPAKVIQRFEILVDRADAAGVAKKVEEIVNREWAAEIASTIDDVERPPSVDVRLEGAITAVVGAMTRIKDLYGPDIRHNVLRVSLEPRGPARQAMTPRSGGQSGPRVGDLRSRVRLGAGALPPAIDSVPVTVAIVDSGLMIAHPAFENHLWIDKDGFNGRQFIEKKDEYDISDQDGHGTELAGTVLDAAADAPVKLMTAKFFDTATPPLADNAAAALTFATTQGARIILLAWDVGLGSAKLQAAFGEACRHALVVLAAGNYGSNNDWRDGQSTARAPVRYANDYRPSTITVMATNEADEKASFSNYGPESVDLAAPGVNIVSTRRSLTNARADKVRHYRVHSGTSPAAAWVAGAAALLMSRYPNPTAEQLKGYPSYAAWIKHFLIDSVDKLHGLKCVSGGRLNVGAALRLAAELGKKP